MENGELQVLLAHLTLTSSEFSIFNSPFSIQIGNTYLTGNKLRIRFLGWTGFGAACSSEAATFDKRKRHSLPLMQSSRIVYLFISLTVYKILINSKLNQYTTLLIYTIVIKIHPVLKTEKNAFKKVL